MLYRMCRTLKLSKQSRDYCLNPETKQANGKDERRPTEQKKVKNSIRRSIALLADDRRSTSQQLKAPLSELLDISLLNEQHHGGSL